MWEESSKPMWGLSFVKVLPEIHVWGILCRRSKLSSLRINPKGGVPCGRYPVLEESHMLGIPCGGNPVWQESCIGGILCGRNPMLSEFHVGGIPWEESHVEGILCQRNPMWKESHGRNPVWSNPVGGFPWKGIPYICEESHLGGIPYVRNSMWEESHVGGIQCGRNPVGRNPVGWTNPAERNTMTWPPNPFYQCRLLLIYQSIYYSSSLYINFYNQEIGEGEEVTVNYIIVEARFLHKVSE